VENANLKNNNIFFVAFDILKVNSFIAFLIVIMFFISSLSAFAALATNNVDLVSIKLEAVQEEIHAAHNAEGKLVLIYSENAPDAEDVETGGKDDSIPVQETSAAEIGKNGKAASIEADSMDYDNVRDVYHARGKVSIFYSGAALYADDVELDNKNNVATACGSALLKMGDDTLQGDKIVFNIENKTGVAYKAKAFYASNNFT